MAVRTIDAIVVNFNTRDLLRAALSSLVASERPLDRIFVVDNASADGSAEMVTNKFPSAVLIRMPDNMGFARANNEAFKRSSADAIFLLNSDAEVSRGTIGAMLGELESEEHIGIVGPVLVSPDGSVQFEGGRCDPTILGEFSNITRFNRRRPKGVFGRYMMNDWDHRSSRDVEVLSGACMLVRTQAVGEQLFKDDFFMYGEDVELCQRVRDAGWRLRYFAGAEVLHHGGAASKKARTRMRVAGVVSMAQLLSRRRGRLYALGYLMTVLVAWPLSLVLNKVWKQ